MGSNRGETAFRVGTDRLSQRFGELFRRIVERDVPKEVSVNTGSWCRNLRRRCASHSPASSGIPASSSPGDELMISRTSDVAVCCSSDFASSWSCLHLVEQPHIVDGDHRLVGEGRNHSICLSLNGRSSVRAAHYCADGLPSRRRGTPKNVCGTSGARCRWLSEIMLVRRQHARRVRATAAGLPSQAQRPHCRGDSAMSGMFVIGSMTARQRTAIASFLLAMTAIIRFAQPYAHSTEGVEHRPGVGRRGG